MPGTKKSAQVRWAARREKDSARVTQEVSGPDINDLSIEELIGLISSPMSEDIDLLDVRRAIELASNTEDVLSACMRKLLRGKTPKEQQVRSLRRLVFGLGDTLLIAKTGFGKSIIFHAYSILTGKITIQLVPLSKLGEEQAEEINNLKYPVTGTNACLVSHETKRKHASLAREIRGGKYTHIITSPEQIAMDWFLELVHDVDFRDRIGLIAIDECHLVSTWATFRNAYAKLFTLRANLLPSVVWFGCTATLTKEQEAEVLGSERRDLALVTWRLSVLPLTVRISLFISCQSLQRHMPVSSAYIHLLMKQLVTSFVRPLRLPAVAE
jgi:superfamily II DNA helicase RecQ